jgi:hypothetical protein
MAFGCLNIGIRARAALTTAVARKVWVALAARARLRTRLHRQPVHCMHRSAPPIALHAPPSPHLGQPV